MRWSSNSRPGPRPGWKDACRRAARLVILCPVLFAGCVQIEGEVSIKEDRSGSAELTYVLTEQTVTQFGQVFETTDRLLAAAGEPAASTSSAMRVLLNPQEESIRQYVRGLSPYGISLSDLRVRKSSGRRSVRMVLAFADLQKAAAAPVLRDAGLRFGRRSDGMWEIARDGGAATNAAMTASAANAVTPVMAGFSAHIKVRTPGAVVETTAPKKSPRAVAWEFDFNRDPQSVEQAFYAPLRVVYSP